MKAILNRELKTCPVFRNLKTLSLGEWCMAADFDSLVSFLRHSPNLERLFLELKLVCVPRYQVYTAQGSFGFYVLKCKFGHMFHYHVCCSVKRMAAAERQWSTVPDLREDHLPVHTLKRWRSNVWRMIVESICWHNCSWTMVYPLRIYMSVSAAPVSHTFALYFCLVFNICFVSPIWYTFAMSVLLGLYCLHGKARLFRSWFLYGALSTPMASYVF